MDSTHQRVLSCIRTMIKARRGDNFELLLDSKVSDFLDSLHLVLLVGVLAKEFKIEFKQPDLMAAANWLSPRTIAALVQRVDGGAR